MEQKAWILVLVWLGLIGSTSSQAVELKASWKEGIRLESADQEFNLKIGGRLMNDWMFATEEDPLIASGISAEDGTEVRRARLEISGTIYRRMDFKAQFDFAGGEVSVKDLYASLIMVPWVGMIRVGHFKEPFSLEELTSSKYITFMERSLPAEAFAPSRNSGLMLANHLLEDRMTWAAGIFSEVGDDAKSNEDGNVAFTARMTGLPFRMDAFTLVHLGLAYSYRNAPDETGRFQSRPESHLQNRFVDTGPFGVDAVNLIGTEAAAVMGPFSVQGEYQQVRVDSLTGNDPDFYGYYVFGSVFLTGENRPYDEDEGTFGRVRPRRNFLAKTAGPGAWELTVRYSSLDLSDASISGGKLDDITVGVNWYLNPNTRVMLNYVRADLDQTVSGTADILQTRFQVDF